MKRVFVPHPQFRFETAPLLDIADDIVYVCGSPMFDDLVGPKYTKLFEGRIAKAMHDFDPTQDIVAFYGDAVVFALMIAYLYTHVLEEGSTLKIARFSQKTNSYTVREISEDVFDQ